MKRNYASYILSTFRQLYNVPDSIDISYGEESGKGIHIPNHAGTFFDGTESIDTGKIVWKKWKDDNLPFLFDPSADKNFFEVSEQHLTVNYDVIASSFYLLSGWHEFVSEKRDKYGRFPYEASIQRELEIVQLPVVNYYFDILKEAIEQFYGITLSFSFGSECPFYIAVTHDIDTLHSGWVEEAYAALKTGQWNTLVDITLNKMKGRDTWNNLSDLLEFEHKNNFTASYYFLPSGETLQGIPHADYSMKDEVTVNHINAIDEAGSEIGIHGPYGSHLSSDDLRSYISRFDRKVMGGRFHYLSYNSIHTPDVLDRSGLLYDSTLGFAEHTGFRNSFAHPFYIFDLENNRSTSVIEIPLVLMDQTLAQTKYMGMSVEEAVNSVYPLLDEVKKFNGGVAVLWHNNFYTQIKFKGWNKVITEIISYSKRHNADVGPASLLAESFRKIYS